MNKPKAKWVDVEFVFADGSKGPGKAARVDSNTCDCIADLGEMTTRFWANANGTTNPPYTNVRLAKPFDEYAPVPRKTYPLHEAKPSTVEGLENSLRIVVISACANGPVEFCRIQRAVDVVRPMLAPLPAEDENVDALPIVESLVNEGRLERVRWARDEENGRTSDPMTAMYAIRHETKARGKRR